MLSNINPVIVTGICSIIVAVIAIIPHLRNKMVRRTKEQRIKEIKSMIRTLNDLQTLLLIEEAHCMQNKEEKGFSGRNTVRKEVEMLTGNKLSVSARKSVIERKIASMSDILLVLER